MTEFIDAGNFSNLDEIKAANKRINNHWFDADTLSFFSSKINNELYGGHYFVTSEQYDENSPRLYSIRIAMADGKINTVGKFQMFKAAAQAKNFAAVMAGREKLVPLRFIGSVTTLNCQHIDSDRTECDKMAFAEIGRIFTCDDHYVDTFSRSVEDLKAGRISA